MKMKRLFVAIVTLVLAAAGLNAQDYNAAVDTFNSAATASDKAQAISLFRSAMEQFQACEGDEALEMVAQCKEQITRTYLNLAKEQINAASYDDALASLQATIENANEIGLESVATEAASLIPNTYSRKGATLLQAKDYAGAVQAMAQAVALDPQNGQYQLIYGQALVGAGQVDEAITALGAAYELGQAAKAGKLLSSIYTSKGKTLSSNNRTAEAIEALLLAVNYNDAKADAWFSLARCYTKSGNNVEAINAYKKFLELQPNHPQAVEIILTVAQTANSLNDKETAIEYYTKLLGTKYNQEATTKLAELRR